MIPAKIRFEQPWQVVARWLKNEEPTEEDEEIGKLQRLAKDAEKPFLNSSRNYWSFKEKPHLGQRSRIIFGWSSKLGQGSTAKNVS